MPRAALPRAALPRAALSRAAVAQRAYEIAADVGFDRLAVAAVARGLGVSVPNIYKHADRLDGLRRSVSLAVTKKLADVTAQAAIASQGAHNRRRPNGAQHAARIRLA